MVDSCRFYSIVIKYIYYKQKSEKRKQKEGRERKKKIQNEKNEPGQKTTCQTTTNTTMTCFLWLPMLKLNMDRTCNIVLTQVGHFTGIRAKMANI